MDILKQLLHDYLVMFGMINAVGNLPIFADLTHGLEPAARSRAFRVAVLTAASIVLVFAVFGNWMLRRVFEVDTASFKIAGGILVFIVAVRGRFQGAAPAHKGDEHYENLAVFPMGFPFLAGPGTIVTTILLFQAGGSLLTFVAVGLVYLTILPLLQLASLVERVVGRVGILVVTRILYIFIAAKAVAFIVDGMRASFQLAR